MTATETAQLGPPTALDRTKARRRRLPAWWQPTWAGMLGLVIIVAVALLALLAPVIAPYDPLETNFTGRLKPPMWQDAEGNRHLLGTDELGRDLLSRLIHGSRISLAVAIGAVPISAFLGVTLGITAGFFRGAYESVVMRLIDVQLALPFILLALAVLVAVGPSFRNIVLLLGITGWDGYARFLRAETLSLRERDYVHAAESIGASRWRIIRRHILPNSMSTVLVLVTLQLPRVIITEASLSFLGIGIQLPTPSWGGMLSEGRQYLLNSWWIPVFPGICITLVVLGGNLFGDWLTDTLNPRRTKRGAH